ncbi:hypothetical protein KR100_01185 [Synechococcus sp. KORDI-100]|nr:hypothetical protein KR100_01185 [Synechococcus sp. KORDI-100]
MACDRAHSDSFVGITLPTNGDLGQLRLPVPSTPETPVRSDPLGPARLCFVMTTEQIDGF